MNRRILIIIGLFSLILLSCKSTDITEEFAFDENSNIQEHILTSRGIDPEDENSNSIELSPLEIENYTGLQSRSFEEIKKNYPDKTILTISNLIIPNDYIIDNLNEYLIQKGKKYVVYFRELTNEERRLLFFKENEKMHIEELLYSVDIIRLHRDHYYEIARKGDLEPWNEYLASESGSTLYKSLPENNWKDVTINGVIYGVTGYSRSVVGPPSYTVNKEIMLKYNISEEFLNKPIYELEEILLRVAEGEKENNFFHALSVPYSYSFNPGISSASYLSGSRAVYLCHNPEEDAKLLIEDSEYLRLLESVNDYTNMGIVGEFSDNISDFFIQLGFISKLPQTNPWDGLYRNKEGELINEEDIVEIVLKDYYGSSLHKNNYANFIPTYSEHKAEAFDFMKMAYSDPYITNLLFFGIENKNFVFENGKITKQIRYITEDAIGNAYLSYPLFYEYPDKRERYWELQESITHPYHDFEFDPSEVEKELKSTDEIMLKLNKVLSVGVEDFGSYIENIKRQLYDNGVQRLLDEVNVQKSKWLKERDKE